VDITRGLPGVAGMRFADIDDVERGTVLELLVEDVELGNLPAKGGSSVAAEDQDHGLLIAKGRQFHWRRAVYRLEGEVRGGVADFEMAGAGVHPEMLEGEHHEREGRHFRHDLSESVGGLAHGDG
jgi:hypothetical protein